MIAVVGVCCAGAQTNSSNETQANEIVKARDKVHAVETSHPGNTIELADALDHLVDVQVDARVVDAQTLAEVNREVDVATAAAGARSKNVVDALGRQVGVLVELNRAAEARPIAEHGIEIAEKEFPGTEQHSSVLDGLGLACMRLGDYPCALHAYTASLAITRKIGGPDNPDLMSALNNLGSVKFYMGDLDGANEADEEALAIMYRVSPNDRHIGYIENNLGTHYLKLQKFDKAADHFNRAHDALVKSYGPDSSMVMQVNHNLAIMYSRTGQFPLAWKAYEFSLENKFELLDMQALVHSWFSLSLAQGGNPARAVQEGLTSARISREIFVLQARTLPERQALAYDAVRPLGLDTSISVVLKHPELPIADIYQEVVRSRALVADEMARRQKNLNANNDPETARLLKDLDQARKDLLAAEHPPSHTPGNPDLVNAASAKMEGIERSLAEHSAVLRNAERVYQATTEDVRHNLPPHSVLISYVKYEQPVVDAVDPANTRTPGYVAFVLHPDSNQIHIYNLGIASLVDDQVGKARAAADAEAHSGGIGSARNERSYRAAALAIRRLVWDPLKKEVGDARLALVVPDGNLNLIPFAALPDGDGYLVEHGPVIHMLTSERDLVPAGQVEKKQGLLAVGSPSFELAENKLPPSPLRGVAPACEDFSKIEFGPLPGTAVEVADIGSSWRRWNGSEPLELVTGDDATLVRFLSEATRNRVLHVATHAFLLDKSCGNGNPLLHSGLVFAGANASREAAILTAQQIASLDLSGVDWAVLSACNTGNGELRDGEGVLGLQRAFRLAGARSVIMTLWPVDDDVTRQFMHELYAQRLGRHATTADAVWNSSRKLLSDRRAAGKSTNPWYWAGFVGSGGWE
ncbi:MAG: CHAT domain-containing tetratricopeptide repeat protein [Terracidiphilus sp.]